MRFPFLRPSAVSLLIVLGSVWLAACGHMPVMSMLKLARLDLKTTDPAKLRAAIKLPSALEPRTQGMILRIGVKMPEGREQQEEFALRESSDPADVLPLQAELTPGTHVFAYQIDPADLPRLTAFRSAVIAQPRPSRGGTLSIQPQACRTGELPPGPILFSTYLRTAELGEYVTLTRDVDLRALAAGQDIVSKIPLCK